MPATLPQIQARLEQVIALRDDAAETVNALALGGDAIDVKTRTNHVAKLQGYQREVEVLIKVERDLVANGKAAENDLRVLSRFDASQPASAAMTPPPSADAEKPPRDTPRNEASSAPLPASGDVF